MTLPRLILQPGPRFTQISYKLKSLSAETPEMPPAKAEKVPSLRVRNFLIARRGVIFLKLKALAERFQKFARHFQTTTRRSLVNTQARLQRIWLNARHAAPAYFFQAVGYGQSIRVRLRHSGNRLSQLAGRVRPVTTLAFVRLRAFRPPRSRPLRYILWADVILGASLCLALIAVTRGQAEPARGLEARRVNLKTVHTAGLVFNAPPRISSVLAVPVRTATPIPTPLVTATPIFNPFSVWEPSLPLNGGWSGAETCAGTFLAPVGSGAFIWPADDHFLAGKNFNYWRHPGLDISASFGAPIYAADAGVVIYAGWNTQGYGNVVIIDHGNGWHTLYAHLGQLNVGCAAAVSQGEVIGLAGSSGRSTGPHLHFEMRNGADWVNPWNYLP